MFCDRRNGHSDCRAKTSPSPSHQHHHCRFGIHIFEIKVRAQVEERIWSDADSANNTQRCASSRKVSFSVRSAQLIGKLCFVDCVLLAFLKKKTVRALKCASQLEMLPPSLVCWCARCAWFRSGMFDAISVGSAPFCDRRGGQPQSKKHYHDDRSPRSTHTHSKMHHHYQHPRVPRSQDFFGCV